MGCFPKRPRPHTLKTLGHNIKAEGHFMETQVVVVIGAGGIGMAIARRQGFGKHILLADFNQELLIKASKELEDASYKVSIQIVDVPSREPVRALADTASGLAAWFRL